MKEKRMHFALDEALYKKLSSESKRLDTPKGELIRLALTNFLDL